MIAVQVPHISRVSGFWKLSCDAGRRRPLRSEFSGYQLRAGYSNHARWIETADSCWPRRAKSPIDAYSCITVALVRSKLLQSNSLPRTASRLQLGTMVLRTACVCAELRGLGPSSTPRQRVEPRVLLQERFFPVSFRCADWARLAINT